jgi:hypothetical protein
MRLGWVDNNTLDNGIAGRDVALIELAMDRINGRQGNSWSSYIIL